MTVPETALDEFVVVVPDVGDAPELEAIAERLSGATAMELTVDHHRIVPTASIGIAVSTPTSTSTSESLLRDTDSALFRAKSAGRARWHFFDGHMHAQAVLRLTLEDELRRAPVRRPLPADRGARRRRGHRPRGPREMAAPGPRSAPPR